MFIFGNEMALKSVQLSIYILSINVYISCFFPISFYVSKKTQVVKLYEITLICAKPCF
jgi:hypothetical protein